MRNKYIFLRHGETQYQAKGLKIFYKNGTDSSVKLTVKGKKQIKDAVNSFKKVDVIYSSPVYRTRQASKVASKKLGLKVKYDKRLVDINFGIYHGRPEKELWNKISELELFHKRPEGGETRREVRKRIVDFYKEIDKKYKDKVILIISHADPIWLLVSYLKGLTEKETIRHKKDYHPKVGSFIKV